MTIPRFRLWQLFALVFAICSLFAGFSFYNRNTIFSQRLRPTSHVLKVKKLGETQLEITCHERPGFLFPIHTLAIPDVERVRFSFFSDESNDIYVAWDNQNLGIVVLCNAQKDDWFVTGRVTGIRGSPITYWESQFEIIQAKCPDIPYDNLPTLKTKVPETNSGFNRLDGRKTKGGHTH